jgi:hypothetical protein
MSDVVEFPGVVTPANCSIDDEDLRHAKAFCDLEGRVCDLERMGDIARSLIMECAAREDSLRQLELAVFAVWQLAKMTREFKADYFAAYHGERDIEL